MILIGGGGGGSSGGRAEDNWLGYVLIFIFIKICENERNITQF